MRTSYERGICAGASTLSLATQESRPGRGGPGRRAVLVGHQALMRILFFTVSSVLGRRTVRTPSL